MSVIRGERLVFPQQQGDDVELVVFGDEFYARYESVDGFTVVYDDRIGLYCFADLSAEGAFHSTGRPLAKGPAIGMRKHLRESPEARNRKFLKRYRQLRETDPAEGPDRFLTFGPNNGLLGGVRVSSGRVHGLTILVNFADDETQITRDQVDAMLNDTQFSEHGNFCSVRRYFQLMSSGQLDYTNHVVGPVTLPGDKLDYVSANRSLIREAFELALDEYDVDLSDYDSRGRGVVDALSFMYAGRTVYQGELWPHNHVVRLTQGRVSTHYYTIQSLGRTAIDLSIGTFTHESGHMLCRFPDLYDYGRRDGDDIDSEGMGRFCLMSSGNHNGRGKTPSAICAFLRDLVDWCDVDVDLGNPGAYEAVHGDYGSVMRYSTSRDNEYFLVENRSKIDLDAALPDGGLAVYHCDIEGSNEWQDGTPLRHYQCALLQADGRRDLENNNNRGDADDFYGLTPGVAISSETSPSSKAWDRSDSGLTIRDIGRPGNRITFTVGEDESPSSLRREVKAHMIIPDNDPGGILSSVSVIETGRLRSIRVGVSISHTYRGDLAVELLSPAGTSVTLHRAQGGPLDNLNLELSSNAFKELQAFLDEPISGDWELSVSDTLPDDSGRLEEWFLELEFDDTLREISGEVAPNATIPDADPTGVGSSIRISAEGLLQGLEVDVNIAHSYSGDLELELVAPNGRTALLAAPSSDHSPDIKKTFTLTSTPSLQNLIGVSVRGEWQLRVRDLYPIDVGTLRRWGVRIRC